MACPDCGDRWFHVSMSIVTPGRRSTSNSEISGTFWCSCTVWQAIEELKELMRERGSK